MVRETNVGDGMVGRMVSRTQLQTTLVQMKLTRVGIAAALIVSFGAAAIAQSPDAAKPAAKPAAKAPAAATAAAGAGDGGLKGRVESLEEQLVDMQVVVGTLESMSKSGGGSASNAFRGTPAGGGADAGRVDALEGQVRSLSTQVQQLSDQVRSLGGVPRRAETPAAGNPAASNTGVAAAPPAFGSTTVTPGGPGGQGGLGGDAIGGLIDGGPSAAAAAAQPVLPQTGAPPPPVTTAALPPTGDTSDPKQLYETAYGYLLQRDYGAAEVSFDEFLKRFPADSLAGNAQYWLGESHFVRGQYKAAAGAFLKGYQAYAQSAKAPDSLLKLAMSLDRLGQKDAACSSFSELNSKFPNAGQSVKARAQSERQRVGCP
jgi:tol-pal system protein YbgF